MSEIFQKNQKYPYSRTSCSLDDDQHLFFPLCLILVEVKGCVMLPLFSFFFNLWAVLGSQCLIYHFMLVYSSLKVIIKADYIFYFLPKKCR